MVLFTLYIFHLPNYIYTLAAVKGLRLATATSHTLNLTWTPPEFHTCEMKNITVTATLIDHRHSFSCIVYKERLVNFCIINGLTPSTTFTLKALLCTNTTFGCITTEGSLIASTSHGKLLMYSFFSLFIPLGKRNVNDV